MRHGRKNRQVDFPVLGDVHNEMKRQLDLWGEQNHPDFPEDNAGLGEIIWLPSISARWRCEDAGDDGRLSWAHILQEEYGEAMDEAELGNEGALYTELIQTAAVALQWAAAIKRRRAQRELEVAA